VVDLLGGVVYALAVHFGITAWTRRRLQPKADSRD
jgi:hypothetical protein